MAMIAIMVNGLNKQRKNNNADKVSSYFMEHT